jgi:prephenate dehydrogenase
MRQLPVARLAVVGLGLVGGSVALAARAAFSGMEVMGIDRQAIAEVAADRGVVQRAVDVADDAAVQAALAEAELVVLALPVLSVVQFLDTHAAVLAARICTDTGSTKAEILAAAGRLGLPGFVGGHPMAGRPTGGLANASAMLFHQARWFLCPQSPESPWGQSSAGGADADARGRAAMTTCRAFVAGLGAVPVEVDAEDHDRDVALTSHVPHLLANVLAETVLAQGVLDAAGGSLREMLQVAGASFDVWGDTLQTNQVAVTAALDDVIARLQALRDGGLADRERLRDLFARGRACRERLHG